MTDLQVLIKRELAIAYDNGHLAAHTTTLTSRDMVIQVGYDMIARAIREALLSEEVDRLYDIAFEVMVQREMEHPNRQVTDDLYMEAHREGVRAMAAAMLQGEEPTHADH